MVPSRSRRAAPLSGRRSSVGGSSFSSEERKLIPQLLELLRSGALSALIPSASPVSSMPAVTQNVPNQGKNGSIREKTVEPTTASGWKPVKSAKSSGSEIRDKLLQNGWSVPIKSSVTEMSSSTPGICLVSNVEARKIVKELKGEHALAILSPSNITGSAEEVHVLVEDPSTRWQTRRRFLIQLGSTPVTYMEGKPKKSFVADSVKVVLNCTKQHTDADAWAHASRNAK